MTDPQDTQRQDRSGPRCGRLSAFGDPEHRCVDPAGHSGPWCHFERHDTSIYRIGTTVRLEANPNWDGVDVYERDHAASDRDRYTAEIEAMFAPTPTTGEHHLAHT